MNETKGSIMHEAICHLHNNCHDCPLSRRNNQIGCDCTDMRENHTDEFTKIFWEFFDGKSDQEAEAEQEAKADKGKLRLTLVPSQIIWDIAEVREYGVKKYYSPDNWKRVELERYRDALFRHMLAYLDDPDGVDEESGISHYKHMACNMAFICAMEKERHNGDDSRN